MRMPSDAPGSLRAAQGGRYPSVANRARYAARMPERELQQLVADLCRLLGLPHFHPLSSRGMAAGWPDSVIVGSKIIYRELKSEHGKLSPEQRAIGDRLKAAGADWKVWRPSDWLNGGIETELRLLKGQPCLPLPL
jgi:hypothetical protein